MMAPILLTAQFLRAQFWALLNLSLTLRILLNCFAVMNYIITSMPMTNKSMIMSVSLRLMFPYSACMTVFLRSATGVHPVDCSWTLQRQSLHGLALVPKCRNYLPPIAACQSTALNQGQLCVILASCSNSPSSMLIKLLETASINYVVLAKSAVTPDKTSPCS